MERLLFSPAGAGVVHASCLLVCVSMVLQARTRQEMRRLPRMIIDCIEHVAAIASNLLQQNACDVLEAGQPLHRGMLHGAMKRMCRIVAQKRQCYLLLFNTKTMKEVRRFSTATMSVAPNDDVDINGCPPPSLVSLFGAVVSRSLGSKVIYLI